MCPFLGRLLCTGRVHTELSYILVFSSISETTLFASVPLTTVPHAIETIDIGPRSGWRMMIDLGRDKLGPENVFVDRYRD